MKKSFSISALFLVNFCNPIFAQQAEQNSIPQTGNVGIGTTTPQTALDVHGSVKIDSVLYVKDSVRIQKNLRVEQDVRIIGMTKMNAVKILGDLNANGLTKVNGELKFTNLEEISNFNNKSFLMTNANGMTKRVPFDTLEKALKSLVAQQYAPKQCPLDSNGNVLAPTWANGVNKIFSACPQVNVGIGTNNPLVKLDVRGTSSVGKIAINATDPVTALGTKLFYLKSHYNPNSPTHGAVPIFLIENSERALFQINNDGIVRSREIKVNLDAAWPDYVFEANYRLQPLSEIKQFIAENGHLPNVPSARQIEEDGVSLGEMNRILLEKVEELTLHLMEQQRLIEVQNQRLNELETKNK